MVAIEILPVNALYICALCEALTACWYQQFILPHVGYRKTQSSQQAFLTSRFWYRHRYGTKTNTQTIGSRKISCQSVSPTCTPLLMIYCQQQKRLGIPHVILSWSAMHICISTWSQQFSHFNVVYTACMYVHNALVTMEFTCTCWALKFCSRNTNAHTY